MKQYAKAEKPQTLTPRTWAMMHDSMSKAALIKPPHYFFVIDLNLVLSTLLHKTKNMDRPTRFEQLVADGIVEFVAPHWMLSELNRSDALDDFLKAQRVSATRKQMMKAWEQIGPLIQIDDRYDYPLRQKLGYSKDIKDEPYETLARDLPNAKLLSTDSGFDRLVQSVYGHQTLGHIEKISDALDEQSTSAVITVIVPTYSLAAVGFGLTKGVKAIPNAPDWVKAGLALTALGVTAAVLHPKSRAKTIELLKKSWDGLAPVREGYLSAFETGEKARSEVAFLVDHIEALAKGLLDDPPPTKI